MAFLKTSCIAALTLSLLSACGDDQQTPSTNQQVPSTTRQILIDFNQPAIGWQSGDSDYSEGTAPTKRDAQQKPLPSPWAGNGFYTLNANRSDDLFVYLKKQIDGFVPNKTYRLSFKVSFITNTPQGCVGVGGSPDAVTIKSGASTIEPITVYEGTEYVMNIDKGNQVFGGLNAISLGNIGNSRQDCSQWQYEEKLLASNQVIDVKADAQGALWLFVGMDSGFESLSHVYYRTINVSAVPL